MIYIDLDGPLSRDYRKIPYTRVARPTARRDRSGAGSRASRRQCAARSPGLREGNYVVDPKRVTLRFQAPPDLPHHRSGAALHLVLAGFGAETAGGVTVAKGPGSLSFEPAPTVYQWSNPGNLPLTYLVFNLNPASEQATLADASPTGR